MLLVFVLLAKRVIAESKFHQVFLEVIEGVMEDIMISSYVQVKPHFFMARWDGKVMHQFQTLESKSKNR